MATPMRHARYLSCKTLDMIKLNHTKCTNLKIFPDDDIFICDLHCTVQEVFGGKYIYVFSSKILQKKLYFG